MGDRGDRNIDWSAVFLVGVWVGLIVGVVLVCIFLLH